MIVEPMVQRGLPRKDSINPLSKKQNLGILTFYKVRLFKNHKPQAESTNSPIEESANSPIDESTAEFLNSLDNDIQKFMYDERTNLKDLDAIIIKESKANEVIQVAKEVAEDVAKDSFRFSYELDK